MRDKKLVRITLIVLFLSLFLVYAIFLQIQTQHSNDDTSNHSANNTTKVQKNVDSNVKQLSKVGVDTGVSKQDDIVQQITKITPISGRSHTSINTGVSTIVNPYLEATNFGKDNMSDEDIPLPSFSGVSEVITDHKLIDDGMVDLTGTIAYFGEIEVTKTLGLEYKYILTDDSGVYYVYMGTGIIDYDQRAKKLGGSVYTMRTPVAILKNNLIGDVIQFVNIPHVTYEAKPTIQRYIVFMVMYIGDDQWVLQIPYDHYHKLKKHIVEVFEKAY